MFECTSRNLIDILQGGSSVNSILSVYPMWHANYKDFPCLCSLSWGIYSILHFFFCRIVLSDIAKCLFLKLHFLLFDLIRRINNLKLEDCFLNSFKLCIWICCRKSTSFPSCFSLGLRYHVSLDFLPGVAELYSWAIKIVLAR